VRRRPVADLVGVAFADALRGEYVLVSLFHDTTSRGRAKKRRRAGFLALV
jgi:hypothetical protein